MKRWLLLIAVALAACDREEPPPPPPPPPPPVLSRLARPSGEITHRFTGVIEPRYRTSLGFRVAGRLVARGVDVGDSVAEGDPVASIEALPLQLAVQSAIAGVSAARARLVAASGAEYRQRVLANRGASPRSQLDTAQQLQQTSEAEARKAEADLAQASEQLTYGTLRSGMAGVVIAVEAQVGQVVAIGQTVVAVARPDVREAAIDIPETLASTVEVGTPFEVALEVVPATMVPGQVREITPQVNAATRTRRVLVALPGDSAAFRLGTTIVATLRRKAAPTIELPRAAVLDRDGKSFVWVVDPASNTVGTHEITVAGSTNDAVLISAGLPDEARVVLAGVHSLSEGQKVRLAQDASP